VGLVGVRICLMGWDMLLLESEVARISISHFLVIRYWNVGVLEPVEDMADSSQSEDATDRRRLITWRGVAVAALSQSNSAKSEACKDITTCRVGACASARYAGFS